MGTQEDRRGSLIACRLAISAVLAIAGSLSFSACDRRGDDGDAADADASDQGTTDTGDESTTGDGGAACGWGELGGLYFYLCGGAGSDPSGAYPYDCPSAAMEGASCEQGMVDGVGCCASDGTNVYCNADGVVVVESCQAGGP